MTGNDSERGPPQARDGFLIAAFAVVGYLLLRQESFYGDAPKLLESRLRGHLLYPQHLLYMPLLALVQNALAPFGVGLFAAGGVLSAVGTGVGVFAGHRAFATLGCDRRQAALAAGLVAACPAVVFFATVVELHGAFVAFAGVAFAAFARVVARPGNGAAVSAGVATALATGAHATGHLLVVLFWALGEGLGVRRRWLVVVTCAHVVGVVALPFVLGAVTGRPLPDVDSLALLQEFAGRRMRDLPKAGWTVWQELVVPYAPCWIAWTTTARVRGWFALAVLAYLTAAFLLTSIYSERGAYLLPLAFPFAWFAVRRWRTSLVVAALAGSLALGVARVVDYDEPERSRAFARGYGELFDGRDVLLLVGPVRDLEAIHVRMPEVAWFLVTDLATAPVEAMAETLSLFDAHVAQRIEAGTTVVVTSEVGAALAATDALYPGAAMLRAHIDAHYVQSPVASHGFSGVVLTPR